MGATRKAIGFALGAAAGAAAGYLALVAWRGVGIPRLEPGAADPATDPAAALDRFSGLRALDAQDCASECTSLLLEPEVPASGTILFYHGFTNCPEQSRPVAEVLRRRGYRVFSPRQPRHGLRDRMTRALADLSDAELIDHVNRTVDIAAGFDGPLFVVGLSGGGVLAAWAAVTREEVTRVALLSPAVSPAAAPIPLVRLFVRGHRWLPSWYVWWNPTLKAQRVQSWFEYPGFPLRGIAPLFHMAVELGDRRVTASHDLELAVLVSNPNDYAVSSKASRWLLRNAFQSRAAEVRDLLIPRRLDWQHDFLDQAAERHGEPDQVADVFLAALGLSSDPTAGGLLEPSDGCW